MRRTLQAFTALAFVACGSDGAPATPGAEAVDSAGVTIVTSLPGDAIHGELAPEPSAHGSEHGVVVTGGTGYEVSVFDDTGALSRIVRLNEAPTVRTDEHLETHVRGSGNPVAEDEASIRAWIASYREMPMPETLPAYTDLRLTDSGELWARRYRQRGAPVLRWDVFHADGHYLGRVEVPASFSIEQIGRGEVVGVSTDEFGVERVEVRELTLSGR